MSQVSPKFWPKLAIFTLLAACLPATFAQSDLTSISGFVKDATGATVPNAQVSLVNESTNQERKTTTNETGYYIFTNIQSSSYTVNVDAAGFRKASRTGAKLDANVPATVNVDLAIGQNTDSVEVSAEAVAIQADSATLGRVVETRQIRDLQLNGRNPILLALLKPGVNGGALSGFSFGLSQGGLNINGSRTQDNLITFDGAVSVRTRANGSSVGVADADATQEVQILTSNYNAEYGRSAGGQVRIVTKSGTREFHGAAYEYFRNSDLDANTWARNRVIGNSFISGAPAAFRFNQFGFNVGGPLMIPKVNKDRNKLFFLFAQEYLRYRQDALENITVPTTLMRKGDFSELLNTASPYYTGKQLVFPGTTTPIPGNIIPVSSLSKNGLSLLNIAPLPSPGYQQGRNNFLATAAGPQNQRKDTGSVDYLPAQNHYIRMRLQNYSYNQYIPFPNDNGGVVPQTFNRPNQTISLNYIWTISPTLINEALVTASADHVRIGIDTSKNTYDRSTYGINYPFVFPTGKDVANKIPTVTITNFQEINGLPYPSNSGGPIYDLSDNITKIKGNHTIKAGFLFERAGQNDRDQINISGVPGGTNNQNGRFVFSDSRPGGSGAAVADAALGLFSTYAEIGPRSYTPYRGFMWEFFVQDSWKITPKLRVEYGFRESIIQNFHSLWGNQAIFDPAFYNTANAVKVDQKTGNPIAGSGNSLNGVIIPGTGLTDAGKGRTPALDSGLYNSLYTPSVPSYYTNVHPGQGFQPRLGIAYQINSKTVLRTGGGRFLTRLGVSDSVLLGGNPPLQPTASISNGLVDAPLGTNGAATYPLGVTSESRDFKSPESWQYNAAVQREVGFNTTVEIAYVGRRGLHQQLESNINQLQPGTIQANPGVSENALRPYLGYGSIRQAQNVGSSRYNGLQIDVERRFSKGFLFGFAYTLSRSKDDGSDPKDIVANTYDRTTVYGPSNYDRHHVIVANTIWQLPFFADKTRLTGKLLGGFQVSMVAQFQTGTPFSVQTGDDFGGVGTGSGNGTGQGSRWLIVGNPSQTGQFANQDISGNAEPKYYYTFVSSTGALAKAGATPNITQPAPGTFTTQLSRNMFNNPGFQNWNGAIFKDFHVTEKQYITFRAEGFNFLNHPNWSGADTNPNSKTFGQVTNKDSNQPQRQLQLSLRYTF